MQRYTLLNGLKLTPAPPTLHKALAQPFRPVARQGNGGSNLFGEGEEEAKVISGVGEMSKNVKSKLLTLWGEKKIKSKANYSFCNFTASDLK